MTKSQLRLQKRNSQNNCELVDVENEVSKKMETQESETETLV